MQEGSAHSHGDRAGGQIQKEDPLEAGTGAHCWVSKGGGEQARMKERHQRGNPDSRHRQDQLSPCVPRERVNCLCLGSDDGVAVGERRGGGSAALSESVREGTGSFKAGPKSLSGLHTHTHSHTHLLSRRFRDCRLRPDHPQEGKQGLISALQGPALSPGLSPHCTAHYTLPTTHQLPAHLTSPSL